MTLAQIMQLRIGGELVSLTLDREPLGSLLLSRDPAVGNGQHVPPFSRSLRTIRRLTATSTDATRS